MRARLIISGWRLTPIDQTKTHAVFIIANDPKGSIPKLVKKEGAKKLMKKI